MKIRNIMFLCVNVLTIVMQGCFSDDRKAGSRKPLNNPMNSPNNYKQPTVADAARRLENKEGVAVKKPTSSDAQGANYKNQVPGGQPVGGITVDHTPSTNLADRNYKIQRVNEPTPLPTEKGHYVKKHQRKKDSTSTGE